MVPCACELKEWHGEAVNGTRNATANIAMGTGVATAGCGCSVGRASVGGIWY